MRLSPPSLPSTPDPLAKEVRRAFRRLDLDRDGRIRHDEWLAQAHRAGLRGAAAQQEAKEQLAWTDLNRDGGTSLGELEGQVRRVAEAFAEALGKAFERMKP